MYLRQQNKKYHERYLQWTGHPRIFQKILSRDNCIQQRPLRSEKYTIYQSIRHVIVGVLTKLNASVLVSKYNECSGYVSRKWKWKF